jgi:hypothetical protein
MPVIHVASVSPGAGRTGVAAVLARYLAFQGVPAGLAREAGGSKATEDAAMFSALLFVRDTLAAPVATADIARYAESERFYVVENTPGSAGDQAVFVCRPGEADGLRALAPGESPVIVLGVPDAASEASAREFAGFNVVAVIPEDRALFGPSIGEIEAELHSERLVEGDRPDDTTVDYVIIASLSSDPGQPYFRRFDPKAVVVRYDKTDLALAAMAAGCEAIILSGGRRPSDYLLDRAESDGIPVLLSQHNTLRTVDEVEEVWSKSRFQGERKLERLYELLMAQGALEAIASKFKVPAHA